MASPPNHRADTGAAMEEPGTATASAPRRPVDRYEWEKAVLRARLTGLIAGNAKGSRGGVSGATFKAIALVWSTHANPDGSNIYPGDATIAVEAEVGLKAVKAVKAAMVELGLTERTRVGARRFGRNDVYRLTLPVDMSTIRVLSPDEMRSAAMDAYEKQQGPRRGSSGPPTKTSNAPKGEGLEDPLQNSQQGPEDPLHEPTGNSRRGSGGPAQSTCRGSGGPDVGGPEDRDTNPYQAHEELHTPDEDRPTVDAQTTKAKPTAPKPRQPPLIPKTALRLPEALQIILTDLHNTGHPEATPDDARTIRATIAAQYGSKATLQYLRGIARNSGYAGYYADLRRERAQQIETQLNKLRATQPDCEHGTAAGRTPHPTTGALLCPQCRHGAPPTVDNGPTTHPAIAAAINAYRRASTHHIRADQLVVLTQQATGLHARGATAEQLAALAHTAGQAGIALLAAALQGGTTT